MMLTSPMQEIELGIRGNDDVDAIIHRVESVLTDHGLSLHTRGTLRSCPGCIHWHWKNGKQPGTLELTYWPAKRRLWIKVQSRRRAAWIDQIVPVLKEALEKG